jgi:uracil-DNA glycosylase family 4
MTILTPLTREDVFKELDLSPVWRLRTNNAVGSPDLVEGETIQPTERDESVLKSPVAKKDKSGDPSTLTTWDALRDAVNTCTRCKLHSTRTQGVVGVGDHQADWLIVGEAPGADEDTQGEPFVGQAGRLLDAMLAAINLQRGNNVYIANVLKSHPPGNRNPEPDEVAACMPYLLKQIEWLQPKIILALGRFAAQSLLNTKNSLASLRGQVHQFQGVPLIVSYHPAYLLRTLTDKAKAWEDLCLARKTFSSL